MTEKKESTNSPPKEIQYFLCLLYDVSREYKVTELQDTTIKANVFEELNRHRYWEFNSS